MPKLTLRDLFAVVTIVALVLAWWVDHGQNEAKYSEAISEIRSLRLKNDVLIEMFKPHTGAGIESIEQEGGIFSVRVFDSPPTYEPRP